MLPNLSTLYHTVDPCGTSLPDCAALLLGNEECLICFNKLDEDSSYGPWTSGGRKYVNQCVNDHYVHKMCLAHQLTTGGRLTTCPECRLPIHEEVQSMVIAALSEPPGPPLPPGSDYETDGGDSGSDGGGSSLVFSSDYEPPPLPSGSDYETDGGDSESDAPPASPGTPVPRLPSPVPPEASLVQGLGGFTWAAYLSLARLTLIQINAWFHSHRHTRIGDRRSNIMELFDRTKSLIEELLFGGRTPPRDLLVSGSLAQLEALDSLIAYTRTFDSDAQDDFGTVVSSELTQSYFKFVNTMIDVMKRNDPYLNQQIVLMPGVTAPESVSNATYIMYTWTRFGFPYGDEREEAREVAEAAAREADPLYLHVEVYQRELREMAAENEEDYETWPHLRAQRQLVSSILEDLTNALEHLMFGGRAMGLPLIPNGGIVQRTWVDRLIRATEALERHRQAAEISEQLSYRVFSFVNKNIVRMIRGNEALNDLIVLRPGVSDPTRRSWGRPRNYITWTWTGYEA